jgi:hypothetical protein
MKNPGFCGLTPKTKIQLICRKFLNQYCFTEEPFHAS